MNNTLTALVLTSAALIGCNTERPSTPGRPTAQIYFQATAIRTTACDESGCYFVIDISDVGDDHGAIKNPAPCVYRQLNGSRITALEQLRREEHDVNYAAKTGNYLCVRVPISHRDTPLLNEHTQCYEALGAPSLWPSMNTK